MNGALRYNALKEEVPMPEPQRYTDDELDRAWRYHSNADSIQHQRHIVFVAIETILFAAFGRTEPQIPDGLIAIVGAAIALIWCGVANTLELRLKAMRDILKADRIWQEYIGAVSTYYNPLGGFIVFNWVLPLITFVLWAVLWGTRD